MANITCQFYSFVLKHNVDINVIVPTPEGNEQMGKGDAAQRYLYEQGLPVVYLLHGAYGNHASWVRQSRIESYAQNSGLVAVMASADNSFYQNMAHGSAYERFFTEELPAFIQNLFPVSKEREKTYIAGFSMGGYGAWYLALSHPKMYSKAASMSGALDIASLYEAAKGGNVENPFPWEDIFDKPEELSGSDADIFELLARCRESKCLPQLYQACGRGDFLYQMNCSVHNRLLKAGIPVLYEEGEGEHNWDFWDRYIQNIFAWFQTS